MFIDENQKEALERLQHDYKVSVAEIIRKAIDRLLAEYKAKEKRQNYFTYISVTFFLSYPWHII